MSSRGRFIFTQQQRDTDRDEENERWYRYFVKQEQEMLDRIFATMEPISNEPMPDLAVGDKEKRKGKGRS